MLYIKPGASIRGMRAETWAGVWIVERIYGKHDLDLTLTEGTGGTHSPGSLHYVGLAADLRSSNVPPALRDTIIQTAKDALGVEFDFVVEDDHFHVEFQPKAQIHG